MGKRSVCNLCKKTFTSQSSLFVHKREKHTYNKTIVLNCKGCLKDFHSVVFNKNLDKKYDKCEECRDLQKQLSTNHIVHNTYIYDNDKKRFFINKGNAIQVCSLYTCNETFPCKYHFNDNVVQCNSDKCNNCYIKNNLNQCQKCIERGHKSKDNTRNQVLLFKMELGGKCIDCGFDDLFFLEFDHIDPSKKTIQITRSSSPQKWGNEKCNLELRCGRCHRIKTNIDRKNNNIDNRNKKCRLDKTIFVKLIKKKVGCCQICKWSINDLDKMCCALDFDHIIDTKYKQISALYTCKKEKIAKEIIKTRLICRHCHELYTCLQRGGKALKFYYSEQQIIILKNKLFDKNLMEEHLDEIKYVTNLVLKIDK